ncbi:MAG: hypothetical protein QM752_03195 [Gammaproteobacteria bacterium]
MKKIGFLVTPLLLIAVTSQANTYTVTFHNPASLNVTMIQNVTPSNSATHIACTGNCSSIPPNGNAIYTISSNDSKTPWGTVTAGFTYNQSSKNCPSGIAGIVIQYSGISVSKSSTTSPEFSVNIGSALPSGLNGNLFTATGCAQ